jgi:hypothetical protein
MAQISAQYLEWQVPEYRRPERGRNWYITAGILMLLLLFFCFFGFQGWRPVFLGLTSNFLFALIIIVAAIVTLINDSRMALMVDVALGPEGVKVGQRFYDYGEFKNFAVLYKPKQSVKQLYFEYKAGLRPRLSLPLRRLEALTVRNFLIKYLDEDLDRTEIPLSEQLTRLLKL